jgi:hypothetical protein
MVACVLANGPCIIPVVANLLMSMRIRSQPLAIVFGGVVDKSSITTILAIVDANPTSLGASDGVSSSIGGVTKGLLFFIGPRHKPSALLITICGRRKGMKQVVVARSTGG